MKINFVKRRQSDSAVLSLADLTTVISTGNYTQSESASMRYADQLAREQAHHYIAEVYSGYTDYETGRSYRAGLGDFDAVRLRAIPKHKQDRISRAIEWRRRDDLIGDLVDIKIDVAIMGFNLQCTTPIPELDDIDLDKEEIDDNIKQAVRSRLQAQGNFQRKLDLVKHKWDLRAVTQTLIDDWLTTDSMILYWKTDLPETVASETSLPRQPRAVVKSKEDLLPGISHILSLSPGDVEWDNSLGTDYLKVRIPDALKMRIQAAQQNRVQAEREQALRELEDSGIARKWIEAVLAGDKFVELRPEDGDHWIIKTKNRKQHGLADPSMQRIFLPAECRKSLTEGDFSAAMMMKDFILHITSGESINQGPLAGQKKNWASKTELNGLQEKINKPSRAMRVYSNHTVKFNFVFPPAEMFSGERYAKVESRIFNWSGVTVQIMSGEGGTYATGFLGIKKLIANTSDTRSAINWVWREFFDHETVQTATEMPAESYVTAVFDEQALKEPTQLLNEIKFLAEREFGNPIQAMRELGRNPDVYRRSSLEARHEQALLKVYSSLQPDEVSSGNNSAGNGSSGRPKDPATPESPATNIRSPSPTT